ncbi:MAG: DUF58 domain-containing protein [Clostridiales bacterium]|nr:DUF58 domain-containing protein [Clostridiales bacterium]
MKKVVLLILIGLLWYLAAMYQSHLLLGSSMAAVVMMLVLFLMPRIQKLGYSVSFTLPAQTMTKGTEEQLQLESRKRGLLPLAHLRYDMLMQYEGQKKPTRLRYAGGSHSNADALDLPFTPSLCGMLTVRLRKARIYDPLGIFSSGKKQSSSMRLAVLPQMNIRKQVLSKSVDLREDRPGDDPDKGPGMQGDLRQIREWQPGDRPSRIHWNLTARLQETMVREWNEETSSVRTLQLEKEPRAYTAEEADRFYEDLADDVQSVLEEGGTVRAVWKDAAGVPSDMTIRETADLESLLLRLMDSRWLWEGQS